ncbi:MAG: SPFH domain-containing protein [Clostridia bacterium]
MGLFGGIRKQMLSVIEWKDSSKDIIVYRYPLEKRDEIMNSSTLVVRESQIAIFVHKGEVADVFGAGSYKLASENIPIITKMLSLPTGFNSPIKAEVYFVNTKQFTGQTWGTQNPIIMRDKEFGNVRIRGFGVYSFKVEDVKIFMKEVFGTNGVYSVDDIASHCRPSLIQSISDAIAESKISVLDLAANYREFSETILKCARKEFSSLGLKLCSVVIENLSVPEEIEKALDESTRLGVLGDKVGTYTRLKAADAMGDAAANPSGGNLAGLGVGLSAGSAMGNMFASSLNFEDAPKEAKNVCVKCGAKLKKGAKFCGECGAKQAKTCGKCGENIPFESKFCPNCGQAIAQGKKCANCGAKLKDDEKFCGECGKKQ